ncbi:exonuclease 1 isoform X2 [Cricetulus griseus]|uniref:Exonuclease 1 n=1 Tax=Cricetulus griseus TaxID=10029 RepID=A0A9J7JQ28_CRIGR|nr:exonuclease 1 isoform X2 [Cricetulus griseus]XP_027274692.1 exonuclease 1 isoform X2 [Cricetulus griseus]ERE73298.1 exonuclease 1 [Cricetulus griseus]
MLLEYSLHSLGTMGIQGLLQFIKEASEPINVKKYKGQAVAVDTYCWLHKGAISCAEKLAKGEPTDKYVGFCMKFVNMLLSHGVKPILVFDGCTLPSKKEVERSRRERRQSNLLKGKQLLREGKVSEARECFTRSVNITHAMAHKVIKAARALGVDCLVAPYEADAQLAYLNKAGIVQAVITEDSDLLAFGCKKVILKMDQFGNGLEVDQARLGMCRQLGDVFTEEKFRYMCILSGCDYLSSLRGIGLAKACKVLKLANNPDIVKVIKKIGQYLKMNITVPEDYITGFIRANNTFLYQLVFDPIQRKLVPLNAYGNDVDPETLSYAGQYVDDSEALQRALGNRDINTFEQIDDYSPDTMPVHSRSHSWNDKSCQKSPVANSIWHRNYCPRREVNGVSHAPPLTENSSTVGLKQVISTKGLNLPRKSSMVKRPRNALSEDDLLSQYSSFTKKTKKNSCGDNAAFSSSEMSAPILDDGTAHKTDAYTPSRTRNKFAVFLRRKNEKSGAVVVPGTRSRFFCSSPDFDDFEPKKASSQPLNETAVPGKATTSLRAPDCPGTDGLGAPDCPGTDGLRAPDSPGTDGLREPDSPGTDGLGALDCPDTDGQKLVGISGTQDPSAQIPGSVTVSPDEAQSSKTSKFVDTVSPFSLGTLRSCFNWSRTLRDFSRTPSPSSSTVLQQFRRKSESPSCLPENCALTDTCHSKSEMSNAKAPPLHEVGWSTPSRESIDSLCSLNASNLSQPSSKDSDSEESDCNSKSLDNQGNQNFEQLLPPFSKTDTLARNKVPGLCRSSSTDSLSTTKIKPLVPARVSGLSKKPGSVQKRKHHDAENKPGLQIKISELWKNFGFKKDSEKLPSCKKPLSPVKDNIQLTPESEDELFNKPECARAQRAIFH